MTRGFTDGEIERYARFFNLDEDMLAGLLTYIGAVPLREYEALWNALERTRAYAQSFVAWDQEAIAAALDRAQELRDAE